MALSARDRQILLVLDEVREFTTGGVAAKLPMFGANRHERSRAVISCLVSLERCGLVARLDDQRLVCWRRTEFGSTALELDEP